MLDGPTLRFAATPNSARSTPSPLPRGKRKQEGRSFMETAVATALQSSASLDGCRGNEERISEAAIGSKVMEAGCRRVEKRVQDYARLS